MGVEYDLVCHAWREVFNLGKEGPWYLMTEDPLDPEALGPDVAAGLTQVEYAERFARTLIGSDYAWSLSDWFYLTALAVRVYAFFERCGWEIEVLSDRYPSDYEPDVYVVVDTRYDEDRSLCPYTWGELWEARERYEREVVNAASK